MQSELQLLSQLNDLVYSAANFKKILATDGVSKTVDQEILFFREKIRAQLLGMQSILNAEYSSRIAEFMLFPIIANLDEKFMMLSSELEFPCHWDTLQAEFFGRTNGGEYVFEMLDEILSNKIYPKISYESVLMVLQDDFLGKYYDNPNHLEWHQYIARLKTILKDFNQKTAVTETVPAKQQGGIPNSRNMRNIIWMVIGFCLLIPLGIYFFA